MSKTWQYLVVNVETGLMGGFKFLVFKKEV